MGIGATKMYDEKSKISVAIETSTATLNAYKTIGCSIVIINLIVICVLFLVDQHLVGLAFDYSFLTLMHVTALTCTIFALKDSSDLMLYPILVSLIAFICIPLFIWLFITTGRYYCYTLVSRNITSTSFDYVCRVVSIPHPTWFHTLILALVIEKTFEFIVFRRLMKIFEQQRLNTHFRINDVNKAFGSTNDADDEIIVYERMKKSNQGSNNDCRISPIVKSTPANS